MAGLFVRLANPRQERERLMELLRRNLSDLDHQTRFGWLYLENPAGEAWTWFLCDGEASRTVGCASVFPKYCWLGRRLARVGQVGDFAIDVAHRSLGPALMLQKATTEAVSCSDLAFCYDCPPHERGMATFRRMRLAPTQETSRFVKPLRLHPRFLNGAPLPGWTFSLPRFVVNSSLRALDGLRFRDRKLDVQYLDGDFDEAFSELDHRLARENVGVRSRRCAEDLNWRYRRDPLHGYDVLIAYRRRQPAGFAVLEATSGRGRLVELVGDSSAVSVELARAVSEVTRSRGLYAVTAISVEGSTEAEVLRRAGFYPREAAAPIVAYGGEERLPEAWHVSASDLMA